MKRLHWRSLPTPLTMSTRPKMRLPTQGRVSSMMVLPASVLEKQKTMSNDSHHFGPNLYCSREICHMSHVYITYMQITVWLWNWTVQNRLCGMCNGVGMEHGMECGMDIQQTTDWDYRMLSQSSYSHYRGWITTLTSTPHSIWLHIPHPTSNPLNIKNITFWQTCILSVNTHHMHMQNMCKINIIMLVHS